MSRCSAIAGRPIADIIELLTRYPLGDRVAEVRVVVTVGVRKAPLVEVLRRGAAQGVPPHDRMVDGGVDQVLVFHHRHADEHQDGEFVGIAPHRHRVTADGGDLVGEHRRIVLVEPGRAIDPAISETPGQLQALGHAASDKDLGRAFAVPRQRKGAVVKLSDAPSIGERCVLAHQLGHDLHAVPKLVFGAFAGHAVLAHVVLLALRRHYGDAPAGCMIEGQHALCNVDRRRAGSDQVDPTGSVCCRSAPPQPRWRGPSQRRRWGRERPCRSR